MTNLRQFLLLLAFAAGLSCVPCCAQQHSIDVGAGYTYVRTNILPGCSCFSLNGGAAQVQAGLTPHLSLLADLTSTHRGNITPDDYQLTLLTYTFGTRYTPLPQARLAPFGEVLFGGAHSLGSLSPSNNAIGGSSSAIAFQTGGGASFRLSRRLRLLPFQADYLLTGFKNGQQNRQNDIRLSAGLIFRLKGSSH